MIVADVDFGSFPCTFPTKPSQPERKETMELGPNAEMSLAQDADESMAVVEVSQKLQSLDMNPTADEAYEQAVLSHAQGNASPSNEDVDSTVASLATHVPAPTIVTPDHYRQFLELLYSRFTQTVAPLPKSITKSFNTPPPRATLQEVDADGKVKESTDKSSPKPSSSTVTRPINSRLGYVPTSRTYCKPVANPARRRTTSAPSNPSSSTPNLSLVHRQVTSTLEDLGSMIKVAEGMMDYMRTDMEEEMKRRRRRARENHQMDTSDDDEPLTRKVPVARSTPWYSATGATPTQDPSVSSNLHVAPGGQRKLITPRRLRARLSGSASPLATIPESSEPGEPLSNDAIEKCASRLTTLKLDEAPKPTPPVALKSVATPQSLLPSNPIRLYMGYNRDCTVRSSFVFGTDMISTPSSYNPTSYEIVL